MKISVDIEQDEDENVANRHVTAERPRLSAAAPL